MTYNRPPGERGLKTRTNALRGPSPSVGQAVTPLNRPTLRVPRGPRTSARCGRPRLLNAVVACRFSSGLIRLKASSHSLTVGDMDRLRDAETMKGTSPTSFFGTGPVAPVPDSSKETAPESGKLNKRFEATAVEIESDSGWERPSPFGGQSDEVALERN